MKMMRILEKQAIASAAKEARKQQAIMAAEERRKQKEQVKILKQQEKIKLIQKIQMEKEVRAKQILEAKWRKREEAVNAKILETEKRMKEKELRRQKAEILKHQEKERRQQHVILMKAVEARKKAEERERLQQEKRDEKLLNKERKLEQQRLELELERELKKPIEDMCLSDHKALPEFSRIPGLILPGQAVSDCLMLIQFLQGFGKVLGLDLNADVPTLGMLQEGLLNVGEGMGQVQDLLVKMLSLAVSDPGLPPGQKFSQTKTMLGDHLTNVGINRDNVSEMLQMYMGVHCANTELAPLALSLKTKAFQAHTPAQKTSILGFLANELACSKAVISEIDKSRDQMANMRKDKNIMERKLKKLRTIHAKRTGTMEASVGVKENQSVSTSSSSAKGKRKLNDSDDEDGSNDQDKVDQATSLEELEKQIEILSKQHNQTRQNMLEISQSLHSMMYGQDRYRRRYWVLPHCGGVFIEAIESGEEELEEERQRKRRKTEEVIVNEEPQEHWFSLLPRSPCDISSLTTTPPGAPCVSPQPSSTPGTPRSPPPSPELPLTPSTASASASPLHPTDLLNYPLPALQPVAFPFIPQGKSGGSLLEVTFGSWHSGVISPNLPLCSSPGPIQGHSLEANTAVSVSSKSESPLPCIEKSSAMPSPALEMPRCLNHLTLQPIPEEMLTGWWRVSGDEQLRALVNTLHSRGIREKGLHRQLQKYMEIIPQVCTNHRDVTMIETHEIEESQVSVESVRGWCVEEQAMEMDIAVLQQVEELERKVAAASLQVREWTYPDPQSEREDLVYYEHKPLTKTTPASDKTSKDPREHPEKRGEKGGVIRHLDNPLDIAVTRLADLERNIERRYLRGLLGTSIQIRLDNVGSVTVPAPAPSSTADSEGGEEEVAHGMKVWRKALSEVRSAAQLAMCIQQLQKSIAWERSIMKVKCQICKKGVNGDLLLLCDGCEKGLHTYCHKPKITSIPEGDWYCPPCISKASGSPPNKPVASSGGGGKKETSRKRKAEKSSPGANQEGPVCVKRVKKAPDNNRDLGLCRVLLAELERHQDAWPFLTPVNLKLVPRYKKVIKEHMDFSTIREKFVSSQYQTLETFIIDVNLVFDNYEKFNEDNSDIGRAGHNMRKFFKKRWTELLKQTN